MANLSKIKRDKMISFLEELKRTHKENRNMSKTLNKEEKNNDYSGNY